MSRATSQSLALIAIMAGAASEITKRRLISRVDKKEQANRIYDLCCQAINRWPETGDANKNQEQIRQWFIEFDQRYAGNGQDEMTAQQLVALCDTVCSDLLGVLRNRQCRAMIEAIHGEVLDLLTWLDPEWRNFVAMEVGAVTAGSLEAVIGLG